MWRYSYDLLNQNLNEKYIKQISPFLTGVIIHLTCELVGANKWYCKNGYACSKKD